MYTVEYCICIWKYCVCVLYLVWFVFHYIVSNCVAFGAFVFGLYWMLQSLCICVFYRSRVFVFVLKSLCICVLYRCRALWSNRAIKLQGRQCQMSPVQLQDKNVKYIKVQKRIWQKRIKYKAVLTQTCFLCSCIHSPFPSISTCLMRKFDHHKNCKLLHYIQKQMNKHPYLKP